MGIFGKWKSSKKLRKAQKFITLGKDNAALGLLENIIKTDPDNEDAAIWTAVAKNSLKDYQGALESIDRVIGKSSKVHFCKMVKGETLLFMERYDESINILTEAFELSPDNTRIAYLIGLNHVRKDNMEKAAEFFELAIKYDRELVDSRLLAMAELYLHKNR